MTSGSTPSVASGCPVSAGGYDAPPQPLGPDSLTWKYFGQWTRHAAGLLGRLDAEHASAVGCRGRRSTRSSSWSGCRGCYRSVYPIGGVVFDGDRAPTTGAEVRDYHIGIKGVDDQGRRYSALNPDVFYWAHATFFKSRSAGRGAVRGRPDRGPEAPAVRRARHLVPDVRDEHAAGAQDLGGIPGVLGSHVPQRVGEQLRRRARCSICRP